MTAWGTSNLVYIPNFVWMHAIATELSAKTRIKNGLNLLPVWILVRGLLWLAAVYIPAKFQVSISIGGLFIALCVQFKMAAAAILFFVESKPWRCGCVPEDILSRCVKCCTNMVNSGWFMVVNWFVFTATCFSNGAVIPSLDVRLSVCLSVRLSVTLVSTDHIRRARWNFITRLISPMSSLAVRQISAI